MSFIPSFPSLVLCFLFAHSHPLFFASFLPLLCICLPLLVLHQLNGILKTKLSIFPHLLKWMGERTCVPTRFLFSASSTNRCWERLLVAAPAVAMRLMKMCVNQNSLSLKVRVLFIQNTKHCWDVTFKTGWKRKSRQKRQVPSRKI